jgi:hypothetical protein
MRLFRAMALVYTTVLVLATLYATIVDLALRNDPSEHMMPNFLLLFVCAPLDLVVFLLPLTFRYAIGWGQLVAIAACGALQAAFFLWLSRPPRTGLRFGG